MCVASSRSFGRVWVALGILLVSAVARADELEDDEVLVHGRQTSGFVSHASMEDAPREVTDAASLVEPLAGVHVRRLGADDSFATLSIRGSSSSQVAVFLAGVPLSGGADPTLDIATLPLWPGARARVHRSFAPASLGRGSLGGTLVLDPPSPRAPPRTEIWMAAGAYGSRRLRIGDVRGEPDGVRVATGLSASRSDDDFSYLDSSATRDAGHDVFATRQNAKHAAAAGLVAVAIPVKIGPNDGAVTVTTMAQARRQELPGSVTFPTRTQWLETTRLLSAVELTLPTTTSGSVLFRGWGRREGLSLHDDEVDARKWQTPTSTDDAIVAAGASTGWRGRPTEATQLELRVDGSGERFAPGTWIGGTPPPAARRASSGLALDAGADLPGGVGVSASGRADVWVDSASGQPDMAEHRPTGNVGFELPLGPAALASHAGFVARPPSFVERYGNRGGFIGDPNLRTESAFTSDVGLRFAERFGKVRIFAEAVGFGTWADDLVTFVYVGASGRAKATNIGRARLFGLESELRATAFGFDARISHTALDTANESRCVAAVGPCVRPPLPGRPEQDLVVDLAWQRGPVRFRYGLDVLAGLYADEEGAVLVPARALHSVGVRSEIPPVRGLSLALDVRNLFDLRAVDYPGILGPSRQPIGDLHEYPLPGRRILLSASWTSGKEPSSP
jgi:hypothetical protein